MSMPFAAHNAGVTWAYCQYPPDPGDDQVRASASRHHGQAALGIGLPAAYEYRIGGSTRHGLRSFLFDRSPFRPLS